jgi:predicted DNA-binding transcriptional regulator AlpA
MTQNAARPRARGAHQSPKNDSGSVIDSPPEVNLVELASRCARLAADSAALVRDLVLVASAAVTRPSDDLITEPQMMARYGMGRGAADARAIPRARVGRSMRWRVSDIEAAITAQPVTPRAHPKKCKMVESGDEIDALIASGAVRR